MFLGGGDMRRTTESVKKSKGTYRNKPELTLNLIQCDYSIPSELSDNAKKEWEQIASDLSGKMMLTVLDRKILMMYCEEVAKYWTLQKDLQTEDLIFKLKDKNGQVVNYMKNPKLDLSDKALTNAHRIGMHFGLTPLSRTKMNITPKRESSPEEKNLNQLNSLRGKGKIVPMLKTM
jgi:P27 family predicted phage terminase small subunit